VSRLHLYRPQEENEGAFRKVFPLHLVHPWGMCVCVRSVAPAPTLVSRVCSRVEWCPCVLRWCDVGMDRAAFAGHIYLPGSYFYTHPK
jgi:hypothetical protein